jgi:hypothetical protein
MSESMGGIIPECPGDFVGIRIQPLGLSAIRLILVDRGEIGFLSHCLPSPFSVTEANGSQGEFVPWRCQKEKAIELTAPRPDAPGS